MTVIDLDRQRAQRLAARDRHPSQSKPTPSVGGYRDMTPSSFPLGVLVGAVVAWLVAMVVHAPTRQQLPTKAPCAVSMSEARAEDDVCAAWLDEDGNVVVGPLWLRDANSIALPEVSAP